MGWRLLGIDGGRSERLEFLGLCRHGNDNLFLQTTGSWEGRWVWIPIKLRQVLFSLRGLWRWATEVPLMVLDLFFLNVLYLHCVLVGCSWLIGIILHFLQTVVCIFAILLCLVSTQLGGEHPLREPWVPHTQLSRPIFFSLNVVGSTHGQKSSTKPGYIWNIGKAKRNRKVKKGEEK